MSMAYTKQPTIDGEGVVYTASFTPDELTDSYQSSFEPNVMFYEPSGIGKPELAPGTIIHDETGPFPADHMARREAAYKRLDETMQRLIREGASQAYKDLRHSLTEQARDRKNLADAERKRKRKAQQAGRRNARKG